MSAPLVEPSAVRTPRDEVERRLSGLRTVLARRGLDAALVLQNADLYYYAGTVQQSYLYVPAEGEVTLFTRKLVERARLESPLEVTELSGARALPELVAERYGALPQRLGLELDVLPVGQFRRLEALFAGAAFADVGPDIVRQRAVKSSWEIDRIRAAAAMSDQVCALVPELLEEGLTEAAFAGRVEAEARRLGHEGIIRMRGFNQEMFYGQLLTGVSGSAASYLETPLAGTGLSPAVAQGVSFRRIGRGEPVVLDFVSVRNGYIADFTRIFSLGELPSALVDAYRVALQIQELVTGLAAPGVTCRALYEAAVAAATAAGLGDCFMGHGPGQVRFIGHGVGVELDELPVLTASDVALEEGMVFALEPKFVLPGLGAIGIENTYCVDEHGLEALTTAPEGLYEL